MPKRPGIDVRPDHWEIVRSVLEKHVPQYAVWAFGSRAKWTAKDYSDLDLAVITDKPLTLTVSSGLSEDFSESDLPWKVDVVDWATTSDSFRKIIAENYVVVQPAVSDRHRDSSAEWRNTSIGEVCLKVFSGGTPTSTNPDYYGGTIPWLRTKEVNYGKVFDTEQHITQLGLENSSTTLVPINSVIVAMYGNGDTAGRVAINKIPLTTNQACCNLVVDPAKADFRFVYYYLMGGYQRLVDLKNGGAQQNLNGQLIKAFPFSAPEVHEQTAIADVLESFDDRITLLRETNATLEAIAQALFKSWFVDFDPVRAKMERRAPEGMDEATAALFPDGFEESALGLVPRGWRVARLDEFIELAYGKALKATDRIAGGVPVYGSGGITGYHNEGLANGPSVIIGRKGTVGSLYWEDQPFFAIDTVFYLKTNAPLTYCFYLLQTLGLAGMNTDAAVPGLNRNNVYRLLVAYAPSNVLQAFDDVVCVIRQRIFRNVQQAQTLATLRDTLLPRLISGALRLPHSEEIK